jgi:hypothetical protein
LCLVLWVFKFLCRFRLSPKKLLKSTALVTTSLQGS